MIADGNEVLKDILINTTSYNSLDDITIKHPVNQCNLSLKDKQLIESFFKYVYFIHPLEIQKQPVMHPEFIRCQSDIGTYKIPNQLESIFQGRKWSRYITINGTEFRAAKNNVRAKYSFRDYTNVNLTNDKLPNRLYGYTVAHIFGGANHPILFSAGFNLALILDGFVKFTDEQHLNPEILWALTSATYLLNRPIINDYKQLYTKYKLPYEDLVLGALFPKINGKKIVKEGSKIKFQQVVPFPFWFAVNVIKRSGSTYIVEKIMLEMEE